MKRTRIKPVSQKRAAENRVRAKVKQELVAAADSRCERCRQVANLDWHERQSRARGGSITDPRNIKWTCRLHHDWAHANPVEATQMGWLVSGHVEVSRRA